MQPTWKDGPFSGAHAPTTNTLPPLDRIATPTNLKARSIVERAGYNITGYVFTHRSRAAKCILDMQTARWITADDLARVMQWKRPVEKAIVPDGFEPPPEDVSEAEHAMGQLAMTMGIGYNSLIPHNTGWFVPNSQDAFPSAGDAIIALFEYIHAGGKVYRPTGNRTQGIDNEPMQDSIDIVQSGSEESNHVAIERGEQKDSFPKRLENETTQIGLF